MNVKKIKVNDVIWSYSTDHTFQNLHGRKPHIYRNNFWNTLHVMWKDTFSSVCLQI